MKTKIDINSLKTIDEEIALQPETYDVVLLPWYYTALRYIIGPIGMHSTNKAITTKTLVCKQDEHILKYIIEPKVESWLSCNPKIIYDVSEIMDVTADYEIVDDLNVIEVDNISVDAA